MKQPLFCRLKMRIEIAESIMTTKKKQRQTERNDAKWSMAVARGNIIDKDDLEYQGP